LRVLGPTGAVFDETGDASMNGRGALAARDLPRVRWLVLAAALSLLLAGGLRLALGADGIESESSYQKLTSTTSAETHVEERAGTSVALSADGSTALVGAPRAQGGGAVWVFTAAHGEFVQSGEPLTGGAEQPAPCMEEGEEGDECGFADSIAISADGRTAVVGAPLAEVVEPAGAGEEPHVERAGAAWVFTRSGSSWQRTELVSPTPRPEGHFGRSVAISANGETVLVGGPQEREGGRAWVFTRSASGWTPQPQPLTSGEGGERFGRSVALAGDGEVALVGSPADAAVRVFEREAAGETWTPASTLEGETGSRFGYSLALSEDGGTALVGAPEEKPGGDHEGVGTATVFERAGSSWTKRARLTGEGGGARERFGVSVALSPEGTSALVGALHPEGPNGVAWLFEGGGGWGKPARELQALRYKQREARGEQPQDEIGPAHFGASVAVSSGANTMLVGAPNDDGRLGAAFVFDQAPLVTAVAPDEGPQEGGTQVTITGQHLLGATAVRFVPVVAAGEPRPAGTSASFHVGSAGEITATAPPGEGADDVIVETPAGVSKATPLDRFTFVPPGHGTGKREEEHGSESESPPTTGAGQTETTSTSSSTSTSSGNGDTQSGSGASVQVLAFGSARGACAATLISRHIAVQARGVALLRLLGTGAGRCAGTLRLRVRLKLAHRRTTLKTIGTGVFSIAAGQRLAVKLKLNATGRRLLRARHGTLGSSLLIVRSSPAPTLAHATSVRLRQAPKSKPKHL
jgi:hypothetical protein